jgi:hypothetical protein
MNNNMFQSIQIVFRYYYLFIYFFICSIYLSSLQSTTMGCEITDMLTIANLTFVMILLIFLTQVINLKELRGLKDKREGLQSDVAAGAAGAGSTQYATVRSDTGDAGRDILASKLSGFRSTNKSGFFGRPEAPSYHGGYVGDAARKASTVSSQRAAYKKQMTENAESFKRGKEHMSGLDRALMASQRR